MKTIFLIIQAPQICICVVENLLPKILQKTEYATIQTVLFLTGMDQKLHNPESKDEEHLHCSGSVNC